jgi:hypothetical protein
VTAHSGTPLVSDIDPQTPRSPPAATVEPKYSESRKLHEFWELQELSIMLIKKLAAMVSPIEAFGPILDSRSSILSSPLELVLGEPQGHPR